MATVTVVIEDGLIPELEIAALRCHCSAQQWAADAVEAALATRRLPSVSIGRLGARIDVQSESEFAELRGRYTGPAAPRDIPVLELDGIEDIC